LEGDDPILKFGISRSFKEKYDEKNDVIVDNVGILKFYDRMNVYYKTLLVDTFNTVVEFRMQMDKIKYAETIIKHILFELIKQNMVYQHESLEGKSIDNPKQHKRYIPAKKGTVNNYSLEYYYYESKLRVYLTIMHTFAHIKKPGAYVAIYDPSPDFQHIKQFIYLTGQNIMPNLDFKYTSQDEINNLKQNSTIEIKKLQDEIIKLRNENNNLRQKTDKEIIELKNENKNLHEIHLDTANRQIEYEETIKHSQSSINKKIEHDLELQRLSNRVLKERIGKIRI